MYVVGKFYCHSSIWYSVLRRRPIARNDCMVQSNIRERLQKSDSPKSTPNQVHVALGLASQEHAEICILGHMPAAVPERHTIMLDPRTYLLSCLSPVRACPSAHTPLQTLSARSSSSGSGNSFAFLPNTRKSLSRFVALVYVVRFGLPCCARVPHFYWKREK
jgi:hypothetical protein